MNSIKKYAHPLIILIYLTVACLVAQIIFFTIHYKVSDLIDTLVQSSLKTNLLHPIVLLPLINFITIQLISYSLFITWTYFLVVTISKLFRLTQINRLFLSLFIWLINAAAILSLNNYFFPDSFFASLIPTPPWILITTLSLVLCLTLAAYIRFQDAKILGSLFIALGCIFGSAALYTTIESRAHIMTQKNNALPNIIFIGLDSVRPDFITTSQTPHIKDFLTTATNFTEAYTPLARTFPAWMSILTGQYPKHSNARTNLANPDSMHIEETLAQRLKARGYETLYGTDEKRFSNISERYGFDKIIGPPMGINDFILGGLNDFPLTNLLINSSLGHILFPYNFANRAAAITYEPDKFLTLVKTSIAHRTHRPLFLAIHLCVSHWPYTWAQDQQALNATLPVRYQSSVAAVDQQSGMLLKILQANGLLENTVVVLLSDHGTTVGLPNDRLISTKNYSGDHNKLSWIPVYKLSTSTHTDTDLTQSYTLNTSYGQGTDILSLKQYHVVLAIKGFGIKIPVKKISSRASLLDITPTILDFLHLPPLHHADGISFYPALTQQRNITQNNRPLFLETGYSINEIQTNDVFIDKVVQRSIGVYEINPLTGQLFVKAAAENSINYNKQRAVLLNNWLLARYPATRRTKLATTTLQSYSQPAYFVIANLKTGKWGIGLNSPLAKSAPLVLLLQEFNRFYGDEI